MTICSSSIACFQTKKKMVITKVIDYEQACYRPTAILGDGGAPPRNYYDPNIMLAERAYAIKPLEEIMVVISGSGYRYNDDTVWSVDLDLVSSEKDPRKNVPASKHELVPRITSPGQLCVLIQNCSSSYTIYVGSRSPLQWLLDMPRVISKLCYSSVTDLTKCRLNLNAIQNGQDETTDEQDEWSSPAEMVTIGHTAMDNTIFIGL